MRPLALPARALTLILTAAMLLGSIVSSPALAEKQRFSVGIVPQFDARRIHDTWNPILDLLAQRTGQEFHLVGSPSIPEFEKAFQAGKFDFVYLNPYHQILAEDSQGYEPLVRDTKRRLFGVLAVKKDSNIQTPKDLNGATIAFPAPNALGASLQMRQELTDDFGITFTPRYVKTHDSVYLNVLLGFANAGGGVQKTLDRQKPDIKDGLRVIHKTYPVAPHPFSAHPRVPDAVRAEVLKTFVRLNETETGKSLLGKIPMKQAGAADSVDYEELRGMGLERFFVSN